MKYDEYGKAYGLYLLLKFTYLLLTTLVLQILSPTILFGKGGISI